MSPARPAVSDEGADGTLVATSGRSSRERRGVLGEWYVLLAAALVIAFLIRTFLLQIFFIPSASMAPTLVVDDRIAVEKVSLHLRPPAPGDVVVFEDPSGDLERARRGPVESAVRGLASLVGVPDPDTTDLVKRVIAVEGQTIRIDTRGQVVVDGERVDEPYVVNRHRQAFGPLTVPEGHLFVMGDNRPVSLDSRSTLGVVPVDHVVGRAWFVLWPLDRAHRLDRPEPRDHPASLSRRPHPTT